MRQQPGTPKEERFHPTQKPVALFQWALEQVDLDDLRVVYDPFLGSGTCLLACERAGLSCYGVEISPNYCDVVVRRWETATKETARRTTLSDLDSLSRSS